VVYGYDDRVRGFFNEGGPFGIFLISAGLVSMLRARLFLPRIPVLFKLELALFVLALCLSGSKAGFLAAAILCVIAAVAAGRRLQRFAIFGICSLVLVLTLAIFGGKFFGYAYAYLNLDEALAYRPDDPSLIMGRVAAAAIVPRMIAAHPVAGIGAGNYSLMRNDPEYLQGLPPVDEWDLPGVGLLGAAAEFGIPLALAFVALLLQPLIRARRARAPSVVVVAAGFQPVAFALGVNLNFFYPWLVAGIALAVADEYESRRGRNQ
jgi:O-antigen ligase